MSGGGSAEAINKTARDDSGDEAEAAADVSGAGKNQKKRSWGPISCQCYEAFMGLKYKSVNAGLFQNHL